MTNLDTKKTELEAALRNAIMAGDVSNIVQTENDLKALEIERFAARAAEIKNQIAGCISRKQELERDKDLLAQERVQRVDNLTVAAKAMREAEYQLNQLDAILFSIESGITNEREVLRDLKDDLANLMTERFGQGESK